jgi:AraC-like DNA-binding protein
MKNSSQQKLTAYCYREEAYQKKIPEITWLKVMPNSMGTGITMEEFRRPKSSFCIYPIKLRDLPTYAKNRLILPLDDYFTKKELSHYAPLAVDICRFNGKLMAIPEDFSPYVLFTRRDLLARYELEPPRDLQEMEKQLRLIKKKTGKASFYLESGGIYTRLGFLTAVLSSFGIDLNGSLEDWSEKSDSFIEAYEWIQRLSQDGLMSDLDLFVRKLNPTVIAQRIEHLKGDIVFYPHWLSKQHLNLTQDHFKHIVIPFLPPARREIELCPPLSGHAWIIPANTLDPSAAIKILKKTQTPELIKGNEFEGGFPFMAWQELWKDPEINRRHPYKQWDKLMRGIQQGCLISTYIRKFELLDESFRYTVREGLDAKSWLGMLFTREFTSSRKITTDEIIKQAVDYMERNLGKIRNVQQVAAYVSMSSNYFSQYFQRKMKIGCGAYLTKMRVERAKQLIEEGKLSIKTIASELGFKHPQTFTRTFRKHTGKSPSEISREE